MTTITKKQHYVPVFYLRAWNLPGKDVAHYYDLETGKVLLNKPETMLAQNYFYEQQSRFPENYIESILSDMESHVAPIFSELNEIIQNHPTRVHEDRLLGRLKEFLSMNNRDTFKEFAAYQYLRIPGAMEQKVRELVPANMATAELTEQLQLANFVKTGYDFIKERIFKKMGMVLQVSFDYNLLTSDWPCFDFRDGKFAPVFGVEIGAKRDIFMILPITPRALLTLFPLTYLDPRFKNTICVPGIISEGQVKNTNTLIIQQARRWLVSNNKADYIWKVASKRKKEPIPRYL